MTLQDVHTLIKNIEPFLSLISAILSITALGFIISLHRMIKEKLEQRIEAVKDQKGVVEERLKKAEQDLSRTEKWYKREVEKLRQQMSDLLSGQNITTERLVANDSVYTEIREELRQSIDAVLDEMRSLEDRISSEADVSVDDPNWYLEMAKAFSLSGEWLLAAQHYERYLRYNSDDWEIHFLRAVAYANSRQGAETDLSALRAYGEAVALAPWFLEKNLLARLHGYRGAILKRLGRLEEAESELLLARKWAQRTYEINDITYNLACVYAMMQRKEEMLLNLRQLAIHPQWVAAIRSKGKYFENYWEDSDFRALLSM